MTTAEERRAQKEAYLASLKSQKAAPPSSKPTAAPKIGLDFDGAGVAKPKAAGAAGSSTQAVAIKTESTTAA